MHGFKIDKAFNNIFDWYLCLFASQVVEVRRNIDDVCKYLKSDKSRPYLGEEPDLIFKRCAQLCFRKGGLARVGLVDRESSKGVSS